MNKSMFIRVSVLIVLVGIIINAPSCLGKDMYLSIMNAIGCWQLGTWSATFANYLVRKYNE